MLHGAAKEKIVDVVKVKRVVALNRQIAAYKAMLKQGVLTEQEVAVGVTACQTEINQLRGQDDLQLVGGANPPEGKAKKA